MCSLMVTLYFCGPVVSTVMFVWQYCHRLILLTVCSSHFHFLFLNWIIVLAPDQFVSITRY